MLDELRSQDWLPRSVRSKTKNIEQAVHALGHRLMRAPTEAEIAEEMGMMLPEYQELLEEARGVQIIHYDDLVSHTEDKQHPLNNKTRSVDTPIERQLCRQSEWKYVSFAVDAASLKKKK